MAVSKAQQRAVTKYDAKAYDKTLLRLPKGKLDLVKAHATARSESVNGFIGRAISEAMEREAVAVAGEPQEAARLGIRGGSASALKAAQTATRATRAAQKAVASLSPEMLETVQIAAGATGEAVEEFLVRAVQTQVQRDRSSIALGINPATGNKIIVKVKK